MSDSISDSISTTGRITVGDPVTGEIETANDRDAYAVELVAGRTYQIDLEGTATDEGTLADPLLRWLRDETGTGLVGTRDDNGGEGANARQTFTPEVSGTYYISARGKGDGVGTYTLTVMDISPPEPPVFGASAYAFDLAENADGSTDRVSLGTLSATDPEGTTLSYSLAGGNESGSFDIDAQTGELFYTGSGEDYESGTTRFTLTVRARDGSETADVTVTVNVTDVNEAPAFGQEGYTFALAENADGSTDRVSLGTVGATDPESVTLAYSLIGDSGSFQIDATSGELFYAGSGEDYETGTTRFTLTVRASDGSKTTDSTVTVNVTDVEETVDPPATDEDQTALQTVSEPDGEDFSQNKLTSGRVAVGETATGDIGAQRDRDWFAVELVAGREYQIDLRGSPTGDGTLSDPRLYGIHDAAGNLIAFSANDDWGGTYNSQVTLTAPASGTHYIAAGAYGTNLGTYTLEVTDKSPADTSSQSDTTTVVTTNAAPTFGQQGYAFDLAENADGSTDRISLGTVSATDPEGVSVVYNLVGDGGSFEIDETSGELFYNGSGEDYESDTTSYNLTVRASDGSATADTSVTVNVTDVNETPAFAQASYAFDLAENADGSTDRVSLGTVAATDPEGVSPVYSLVGDSGSFEIDETSGELFYNGSGEDYESGTTQFTLTVRASDGSETADTTVTVNLTDVEETADPPPVADEGVESSSPQTVSEPGDEDFSADTSTAGKVVVGETATGDIGAQRDRDWFAVDLVAGREYQIDLRGRPTGDGTLSDPRLYGVHDADGNRIARTANDDGGEGYNSRVTFTATASGTHYIAAGAYGTNLGSYTLEVTDNSQPDVQVPGAQGTSALPMIQVADAEATEGDDTWIVFRVTLDRAASGPVTVSYTTADGTAQARTDYLEAYGTLTFAAGETEKTVRVAVINDAVEDSGETFRLVLSNPTGAQLADAEAVGTILNAERPDDYAADTTTTGTVSVGSTQTGELESAGDMDWMKVTLVGGTRYVIDYEGADTNRGTLFDPYLSGVYDANGNLIPGTTDDSGGQGFNSRVDFTPDTSGTYFIGLQTTSPYLPGGTYRVRVSEFDDYVVEVHIPDDDYADNTTTEGSVSVGGSAVGNYQQASSLDPADWIRPTVETGYFDHDWFRVTFDEDTTYRIEIKGSWSDHGTLRDTRIAGIYDSNGNLIDGTVDDNSGIDVGARTIFTAPTAGTYYIAATRGERPFPTQNSGTYTVEVSEVGEDDYAADTTTSGSVEVEGSTTATIERLGDLDWFAVTLEGYATYRFDLEGIGDDWRLLEGKFIRGIYDSNGDLFAGSYTGEVRDGEVRAVFTPEQDGTYYVAVGARETFTGTGEYRLSAAKFIPEFSDWLDTEGRIGAGFTVAGAIEASYDKDWFRITLEADKTYQIDLEGSPTNKGTLADPYLHGVYDAEGDLIWYTSDADSGVSVNSRVTFTPDTDGTYYIAAGTLFGRTGTYELSVDEVM